MCTPNYASELGVCLSCLFLSFSLISFMGRGVVNAPVEKVQAYIADYTNRKQFDPMCSVCGVCMGLQYRAGANTEHG